MQSTYLFKPPETRATKAGKVILRPGESIGEHSTEKREETIVVVRGTATVSVEGKNVSLEEAQAFFIPEGKKHNVSNNAKKELEYVYVVNLLG
jgi:quercetin dioxygenase-like cupin family protein